MPVDRWVDLARDFGEPPVPADLREQVERRIARRQVEAGGSRSLWRRFTSMGRWVAAGVGVVLLVAALGLAAHSRRQSSAPAQPGHVEASVVLLAQQGHFGAGSVVGWRTTQHALVTCGARPAVTSSVGNNGIRPSDLCRALAYYPAHSTESRCSYASITGPVAPRRVLVTGTVDGKPVHLNMGMICNPPARLARMSGLIWATVFGYPNAVKATISEKTFKRLTRVAQSQAQALGDPKVHSATVVLTTRRRMNSGLGIGYQASQDQSARVFVIQLVGTFTCNNCSYPAGGQAPTGSAAQDVLSYRSLAATDFGITPHPAVMQRMGPVMHLTWKPRRAATQPACHPAVVHYDSNPLFPSSIRQAPYVEVRNNGSLLAGHLFYYSAVPAWHGHQPKTFRVFSNGILGGTNVHMKILWTLTGSVARRGLAVRGVNQTGKHFTQFYPGGSQMPSYLTVPSAGCWRLSLDTGTLRGSLIVNALPTSQ
jgi:hypothetical protein